VRLIDRLTASRSNLPDPEYVAGMSLSQTWDSQPNERIVQTYVGYSLYGFAANSVVFSCVQARMDHLAQAQFKFQDLKTGKLFGTPELQILETPWPNGTTSDLVANMEQHDSVSGNSFVRRQDDQVIVMRPDWVDIVSIVVDDGLDEWGHLRYHRTVAGYLYSDGGIGVGDPVFYDVEDVVHWAPMPDPLSHWRGMSWLTPVLREVNADTAMTQHLQGFLDNAATPSLLLRYKDKLNPQTLNSIKDRWQARFGGPQGAGATVVLDEGADVSVIGSTLESMRFAEIRSGGEGRIASASGVPAIVAGLQAGLDAATYSNYKMAQRAFINGKCSYLWASLCAALAKIVVVPDGARLWYDTTSMPALREDLLDRANAMAVQMSAASTGLTAGYESESITAALTSGDLAQLKHTGLVSVQLYKAAAKEDATIPALPVAPPPGGPTVPDPALARTEFLEAAVIRMAQPADPPTVNLTIAEGAIQSHTTISDGAMRTTVERAEIRNEIAVPAQPSPDVNVTVERADMPAPVVNVTVEPTPVTVLNDVHPTPLVMPARKSTTTVERDRNGLITKTTATEKDA
jgi:HK97 family phage portal protein